MSAPRSGFLPFAPASDWSAAPPPDLSAFDTIELDCESTGLDRFDDVPVGIAIGTPAGTQYLPVGHRGGGNLDPDVVKRWAQRELRGKRIRNAHIKVDLHWMQNWGVDLRAQGNTFHDVAHSEALLDDHQQDFSLEALAQKRLGRGKLDGGPGAGIADLPASAVAAYACQDVALVRDLCGVYAPLLTAEDLDAVSVLEDAIIPVCIEMERNGLPLDLPRLERWERDSRALLERLHWELYRGAGWMVNVNAAADWRRLFALVQEPIPVKAKKTRVDGGYTLAEGESFEAELVKPVAARHPIIDLAYRIGKLEDLRSKSIVKYLKDQRNGVLYPAFHQLKFDRSGGAVSGRFSSSGPNGQNIMGADAYADDYGWLAAHTDEPWIIRDVFVAGTGSLLVADQNQVEIRIAAHFARATALIAAWAQDPDADPHRVVQDLIRSYRPSITRTQTKITSFRRLYGSGAKGIGASLGLSDADAYALVEAYDRQFPEWKAFLDRASRRAEDRGYVQTILKRRARFRPGDRYYSAANRVCQGTSADILKLTLVDLYAQRHTLGLTLRATVHDEVVADAQTPDAGPTLALLNVQRVPLSVPILWKAQRGRSWHEAK